MKENRKTKIQAMKTIRFLSVLALFALLAAPLSAQVNAVPAEVVAAINSGDANKLSLHLNDNVELVISGKNNVYSKKQATGILSDFFKKNPVKSFTVTHQSNKAAASFVIGKLNTSNGDYRIYILTRKSKKDILIQQLRIENE